MITIEQFREYLYYNLLPEVYREEDVKTGWQLKQYLYSLVTGETITDINNFLNLVDPLKCPSEFFPYLLRSFGWEYTEKIEEKYQRKFLQNIGELNRRHGTYSAIKYLSRVLTGMDAELTYTRSTIENVESRNLYISLQALNVRQRDNMDNSIKIVQTYIESRVPFYITTIFMYSMLAQVINITENGQHALTYSKFCTLRPA